MATDPNRTARLVSMRELPRVVDSAIEIASKRIDVTTKAGSIVVKWELIGRILNNFEHAQLFATTVSEEISKAGVEVHPAVLSIDKRIIAGFYERASLPQLREF